MQRNSRFLSLISPGDHGKYVYSLAFVLAFLIFLSTDVLYFWLRHFYRGRTLRLIERISIVVAVILFFVLFKKVLPSAKELTPPRASLVKKLKDINDPLLSLRFFGFFCVIVTHCLIIFNLTIEPSSWHFLLYGCAHSGMVVFFCMSGYLMGKAFYSNRYRPDSSGIKSFYQNRALRIVPLAYFASFVVIVFVHPDLLKLGALKELWRPLLFLYYAGDQPGPIGALWALSVEAQYYIIAPFIFILLSPLLTSKSRAYVFMVIVFLSGLGLKYFLFTLDTDWVKHRYMPLYANLDFFLVGFGINCLIEQDEQRIRESSHYKINAFVAVILCFLIFIIGSGGEYSLYVKNLFSGMTDMRRFYTELVPLVSLILTFIAIYNVELYKIKRRYAATTRESWYSFGNRVSKALQVLGLLSFSLYVWHPPVLTSYSTIISKGYNLSNYFFICTGGLLLLVIMCFITYFMIERPFENYRQ